MVKKCICSKMSRYEVDNHPTPGHCQGVSAAILLRLWETLQLHGRRTTAYGSQAVCAWSGAERECKRQQVRTWRRTMLIHRWPSVFLAAGVCLYSAHPGYVTWKQKGSSSVWILHNTQSTMGPNAGPDTLPACSYAGRRRRMNNKSKIFGHERLFGLASPPDALSTYCGSVLTSVPRHVPAWVLFAKFQRDSAV